MAKLTPLKTDHLQAKFAWERPERKDQSGKLAVFGGVSLKLKEVDTVFKQATKYGIGSTVALVPESLAKVFKRQDQYLAPVVLDNYFGLTDSGLETIQEELFEVDALILVDIGNSSATGLRLARLISNTTKRIILTDSSASLAISYPDELLANPSLTLILSLQNLQKTFKASSLKSLSSLSSTQNFKDKLEALSALQVQAQAQLVLFEDGRILAVQGSSYINETILVPLLELAANLTSWQIWSPTSTSLEQLFAANNSF